MFDYGASRQFRMVIEKKWFTNVIYLYRCDLPNGFY